LKRILNDRGETFTTLKANMDNNYVDEIEL